MLLLFFWCVAVVPVSAADDEEESADEIEAVEFWSLARNFHWVGTVDPAGGELVITVNDEKPVAARFVLHTYKESVHAGFLLERGENNIAVRHGEKTLFQGNIVYAASFDAEVPDELTIYAFHSPDAEAPCVECHRMEPTEADQKPVAPKDSMCYGCHRPMFAKLKSQHKPFVQWHCLECHQAEATESEFIPDLVVRYIIAEGLNVGAECYRCHQKQETDFAEYEYQHGPVGEGSCTLCHDPHGTMHPRLLHKKELNLCVDCHEMADILEAPVVHRALTDKGCIGCHDPHGSNFRLQLKKDSVLLCLECHKDLIKMRGNHPVRGHPTDGVPDPRDKDRPFTCTSCHNPHSSDAEKLLPEEEIMMVCVRCHKR